MEKEKTGSFRSGIIGESISIKKALADVSNVMATDLSVLIIGESGVGKELFARAIHEGSNRKKGPFITVNCAAISPQIAESLLFGHASGSFTGANRNHTGFFEQADGGTLFLDEIGDMCSEIQSKVLRALQEKKIRRVGEKFERGIDFRIISATNQKYMRESKYFRDDLYFRLEEFLLYIPPLRERKEDIPLLAKKILAQFCKANNLNPLGFSAKAIEEMMRYDWPGNIREFRNAVMRSAVTYNCEEIESICLRENPLSHILPNEFDSNSRETLEQPAALEKVIGRMSLEEMENLAIKAAYKICGGDPIQAAKQLGIGKSTIYRKIKELDLNHKKGLAE